MQDSTQFGPLSDLIARCILAFERGGDAAVEHELAAQPALAPRARENLQSLRRTGLLAPPQRPTAFGPYRVVHELGTGGMGTVWLCEQEAPVRRHVAVKVMRHGVADAETLVRFQLEREALARLTDPCIARVLDAGVTADRHPYLVMDYVQGTAIRQFCDARRLDIAARLQLFARVCDAVQHAHQKGIVHRDLKPGNVLVVERDGEPLPVVIDFGVAKSIAASTAGALTIEGKVLGTPAYMSPEQARGELDIDTRTDVYALGVLLYELLTGCLPIDPERLRNLADIGRVLDVVVPPRATARFLGLAAAEQRRFAAERGTTPQGLVRTLRRELDWILQCTLEKDRNRRYGTAAELAHDVRRHLARLPVSASPPSRWLAVRRFCERHRLPVLLLSGASMALVALATTSLLFWRDAAAAELAASTTSRRLEQSLDDALAALDQVVTLGVDGLRTPESQAMRNSLLHTVLDLHERLISAGQGADDRLAASLAETLARAADLHDTLGEEAAATPLLERAETTLRGLAPAAASPAPGARLRCARAHVLCGQLRMQRSEPVAARQHYETALALFRNAEADGMPPPAFRCDLLIALQELSDIETDTDVVAADRVLAQALPIARALLAEAAASARERTAALRTMARLAWLRCETAQLQQARDLVREVADATAAARLDETPLTQRLALAPIVRDIASTAIRLRDSAPAARMLPQVVATLREAIAIEPTVPAHRRELALALTCQALLAEGDGDPKLVDRLERESIDLFVQSTKDDGSGRAELMCALLDVAMQRLDWQERDAEHRALVDLDLVQQLLRRAEQAWAELPPAVAADRHSQETWTGWFRVRAALAAARGDVHGQIAALVEGETFTRNLVTAQPDVVQLRLIAIEMQVLHAKACAGTDPAAAWRLAYDGTSALAAEAPRYADPVLWPRLAWTLRIATDAIAATARGASAEQRSTMRTTLLGLAALADRAGHDADATALRRLAETLVQ